MNPSSALAYPDLLLICVSFALALLSLEFLFWGSIFHFFPEDLRGSAEIKGGACSFVGLTCSLSKKQGKEENISIKALYLACPNLARGSLHL